MCRSDDSRTGIVRPLPIPPGLSSEAPLDEFASDEALYVDDPGADIVTADRVSLGGSGGKSGFSSYRFSDCCSVPFTLSFVGDFAPSSIALLISFFFRSLSISRIRSFDTLRLKLLPLPVFPLSIVLTLVDDRPGLEPILTLPMDLEGSGSWELSRDHPDNLLERGETFFGAVSGEKPEGGLEVRITGGIAASSGCRYTLFCASWYTSESAERLALAEGLPEVCAKPEDIVGDGGTEPAGVDVVGRRLSKRSSAGVEMAESEDIREDMTSGEAGGTLTLLEARRSEDFACLASVPLSQGESLGSGGTLESIVQSRGRRTISQRNRVQRPRTQGA